MCVCARMWRSEDNFGPSASGTFCHLSAIGHLMTLELEQVGAIQRAPGICLSPSHHQGNSRILEI